MNIVYHASDSFAKVTGTSIVSIFENNKDIDKINVYVIEKNFTEDNKKKMEQLADKYNMKCWTNIESFDRDMPIRFLPIKWEKLLLKLDAARRAGMENAITFEFSHFMSPNSAYLQAGHLYERYCEHFIL